jgi:Lrp/AsnC family transcriptional regulator for asnA, asnC and gidA
MDSKDRKIIEMLEENGRASFTRMAKRLLVSEATVRKRVKALEKDGVIKKYCVVVDPFKLGYHNAAIIGLDVEPALFLEAARKLAEFPETRYVATSTGDHMIMTEVWAKNGQELTAIIANRIGKIAGVRKICPAIILEKIKDV